MSHGNDQLLWEYVFKPILKWFGISFDDNGSIIFWRWNRFTAFVYHKVYRVKSNSRSISHLDDCKHCSDKFDKWREKNMKRK